MRQVLSTATVRSRAPERITRYVPPASDHRLPVESLHRRPQRSPLQTVLMGGCTWPSDPTYRTMGDDCGPCRRPLSECIEERVASGGGGTIDRRRGRTVLTPAPDVRSHRRRSAGWRDSSVILDNDTDWSESGSCDRSCIRAGVVARWATVSVVEDLVGLAFDAFARRSSVRLPAFCCCAARALALRA